MKKILSIVLAISFLVQSTVFALSPEPGSRVVATKTGMDAMGEDLFAGKHGPLPIDFSASAIAAEDICITLPQLKKAYAAFKDNKTNKKPYDLFAPKAPHGDGRAAGH